MTDKPLPTQSIPPQPPSVEVKKDENKVDAVVPPSVTSPAAAPLMAPVTPPPTGAAPQTKSSKMSPQMMFAALGLFILVIGAGVGFYLLGKSQEIRQQAAGGYADCAGGVKDGEKACSGFREVVVCHNGAFAALRTCEPNEKCDKNAATGCVPTARDCAGGVKDGQTACSGLRTQVTCRDGVFVDSIDCTGNQTCSAGKCGGSPEAGWCDRSGPNTTQCTDKAVGTSCRSTADVAGSCQQTIPGGANSECTCAGSTVTPSPSPSATPGVCAALGSTCNDTTNPCCGGGVCQGVGDNRRCEARQDTCNDPDTTNDGVCGGTNGWLGFRCNNLTNGQCVENSETFSRYEDAYAYASANGCGQVDQTCVGGWKDRQLCGSFQIIATNCGGSISTPQPSPRPTPQPSPTPGVTPSPQPSPSVTPSPTPAPICAYIAVSKPNIVVGDDVTFTCGIVPGATAYQFRVQSPDGTQVMVDPVSAGSNISAQFSIAQQGDYKAQCRICVGQERCQEWEAL